MEMTHGANRYGVRQADKQVAERYAIIVPMRRFFGLSLLLLAGMTLVCLAVSGLGHALATQSELGVGICDGQPCVQGVIPGKTAWQTAQARLSQKHGARIEDKSIRFTSTANAQTDLYISVDLTNVGRIAISPSGDLTLGWLIAQYGVPCGITIYRYSNTITIRYPALLANIEPDAQLLRVRFPLKQVLILDPAFSPVFQPNMCVDNMTDGARNYRWAGFATPRYYIQHMNLWQQ